MGAKLDKPPRPHFPDQPCYERAMLKPCRFRPESWLSSIGLKKLSHINYTFTYTRIFIDAARWIASALPPPGGGRGGGLQEVRLKTQ
jgi:hypothetical protein